MDAFYASVEQRDNPELLGKPIAVGGSKERGVVAAASYEARKYGVKSAMPSSIAYRKCPKLIFVKPRFEAYKEASQQIREVFEEYTDLVEPLALDEAYLDVTENKFDMEFAMDIATEIKKKCDEEFGGTWHCIVGRNFGSSITHDTKYVMFFQVDLLYVLLFKSFEQKKFNKKIRLTLTRKLNGDIVIYTEY